MERQEERRVRPAESQDQIHHSETHRLLGEARLEISDRLLGRPAGRGRLGRLEEADRAPRRQAPNRRRRPLRHEHETPREGHQDGRGQRNPDQAEPDRLADRDHRSHPARA